MALDERSTLDVLKACFEAIDAIVRKHDGRLVSTVGDHLLAEFPSVVSAVACAAEFQREIGARNADVAADRKLQFRVGVHLGDVVVEGDRIYGDGVNIAAQLKALADPGGFCTSGTVYEQVLGKAPEQFENLGEHNLKNIPRPVNVYRVSFDRIDDSIATLLEKRPPSSELMPKEGERRVKVQRGEAEWVVGSARRELSFGRDKENDISIENPYVSRRHGVVAYRDGELVLTDNSSNGTVIRDSAGSTEVHRDSSELACSGTIQLGNADGPQLSFVVEIYRSKANAWTAAPRGATPIEEEERPQTAQRNLFRKEGEYWTLRYEGQLLRLKDSKGLRLLSHLMQHPGSEMHALDLASVVAGQPKPADRDGQAKQLLADGHVTLGEGVGPILDAAAKADYRRRLADLNDELKEAERFNDIGRAERARTEMELLEGQLALAIGLGGRDRPAASNAERARVMITHRIRDAMKKIRRGHPGLGAHLAASIHTGMFCSYTPDRASKVTWWLG